MWDAKICWDRTVLLNEYEIRLRTMNYIDAHSHLSFIESTSDVLSFIEGQKSLGITQWVQGGYDEGDWKKQLVLKSKLNKALILGFGIHPWVVDSLSDKELSLQIMYLTQNLSKAEFLGEVGLDYFKAQSNEEREKQRRYFEAQLQIDPSKPILLHVVQAHEDAMELLKKRPQPCKGYVHSFSGSAQVAESYLKLGFKISIGPSILNDNFKKLRSTVENLPLECFLIESDYPQDKDRPHTHQCYSFFDTAQKVAEIKGVSRDEVLAQSRVNLEKMF